MREQKQLYLHRPAEKLYGDCWRTCIACLLDVAPDDIPHYYEMLWKAGQDIVDEVHKETNRFLAEKYGVRYVEYPIQTEDFAGLGVYINHYYSGMHVILGCNSTNGGHSVIVRGHNYLWDPAIDNSGCVGPMDDGYYWIGLLVPAFLSI